MAIVLDAVKEKRAATPQYQISDLERRRLLRGLDLLARFIAEFEVGGGSGAAAGGSGAASASGSTRKRAGSVGNKLHLTVSTQPTATQLAALTGDRQIKCVTSGGFEVDVFSSDTVGELREHLAERWDNKPAHMVRIIWTGRELKDDHQTLRDVGVQNNHVVHVTRRMEVEPSQAVHSLVAAASREPANQPSSFLALPQHFDVLFGLLELGAVAGDVGERAWSVLAALPTNHDVLRRLRAIELEPEVARAAGTPPPAWPRLLDTRAPLTLLYSLQIVHGLLLGTPSLRPDCHAAREPETSSGGTSSAGGGSDTRSGADAAALVAERRRAVLAAHQVAAAAWQRRFVATGGVAYLLGVLLKADYALDDAKRRQCLTLLLNVVNLCTLRAVQTDDASAQPVAPLHDRDFLASRNAPTLFELAVPLSQYSVEMGTLAQKARGKKKKRKGFC